MKLSTALVLASLIATPAFAAETAPAAPTPGEQSGAGVEAAKEHHKKGEHKAHGKHHGKKEEAVKEAK